MMNSTFNNKVYDAMDFFCAQLAKQMIYQNQNKIANELDEDILVMNKQINKDFNPPKQQKISTSSINSENNNFSNHPMRKEFTQSHKFLIRKSNTKTNITSFLINKFQSSNVRKKNSDMNIIKKSIHSKNWRKKHNLDDDLEVELVPIDDRDKKISDNEINKNDNLNNRNRNVVSFKEEKSKTTKTIRRCEKKKNTKNYINKNLNVKEIRKNSNPLMGSKENLSQILSGSEESEKNSSKSNSNKNNSDNYNDLNKTYKSKSIKSIINNTPNKKNKISFNNDKNSYNSSKKNIKNNEIIPSKKNLRRSAKILTFYGKNNIFQKSPKKENIEQANSSKNLMKSNTKEQPANTKTNYYSGLIGKLSKSFHVKMNNINNNIIKKEKNEDDENIITNTSTQLIFDYYINSKTTKRKMNFIEKQMIRQKFKEKSIEKMKTNLEKKKFNFIFKPELNKKSLKIAAKNKNPPLFQRAVEMENSKLFKILMNEKLKINNENLNNSNCSNSKKSIQEINDFFNLQMEWKEKINKKTDGLKNDLNYKDNQEFSEILSHKFKIDPYSEILINKSIPKDHHTKYRSNYFSLFKEYNQNFKGKRKNNSFTRLYKEREIREIKLKKLKKKLTPNFRPATNNHSSHINYNYFFKPKSSINTNNIIKKSKSYIIPSVNNKSTISNNSLINNNFSLSISNANLLSPILQNGKIIKNKVLSKKTDMLSALSSNNSENKIKSRNYKGTNSKKLQTKNTGILNMASTSMESKNILFKYTNKNNNNETINSNTKLYEGKSNISNIIEEESSSRKKISNKNVKNKNYISTNKLDKSFESKEFPTIRKKTFEYKNIGGNKFKRSTYLLDKNVAEKLKAQFQKDDNDDFQKINKEFPQSASPEFIPRVSLQLPRKSALKKNSSILKIKDKLDTTSHQPKKNVTVFEDIDDNLRIGKTQTVVVKIDKNSNPKTNKKSKDKNDKNNEDSNLDDKMTPSKKTHSKKSKIYEEKIIDSSIMMSINKKENLNNDKIKDVSTRKTKTSRGMNESKIILYKEDKLYDSNENSSAKNSSNIFSSDKALNSNNSIFGSDVSSNKNILKINISDKQDGKNQENENDDNKNSLNDEDKKEEGSESAEIKDDTNKNEKSWIKKLVDIKKNEKTKVKNERNDFEKLYMLNVRNNSSSGYINPFTITANKGIFYKFFSKNK